MGRLMSPFQQLSRSADAEVILMMVTPATPAEANLLSCIFDTILIPAEDRASSHVDDLAGYAANVFLFRSAGLTSVLDLRSPAYWRAKKSTTTEAPTVIDVQLSEKSAMEGSTRPSNFEISYTERKMQEQNSGRACTSSWLRSDLSGDQTRYKHGIFCRDLPCVATDLSGKVGFVVLLYDQIIRDAVAQAAKAGIRATLFSARSGLEAY